MGFDNVYILEGGIVAWNAGGQVIYTTQPGQTPGVAPYSCDLQEILKHPQYRKYEEKNLG